MAIAEFLSDITIFLYAFSLALLWPRAAVPGAGAHPPRRAALALLPLVPLTPHAHDAASFRNLAAPVRTDDRRTNDATSGPQEWLTGSLHDGGIRSVRSPLRRAPLLATPIATPLQCGRPERSDLLFNFSPTTTKIPFVVLKRRTPGGWCLPVLLRKTGKSKSARETEFWSAPEQDFSPVSTPFGYGWNRNIGWFFGEWGVSKFSAENKKHG